MGEQKRSSKAMINSESGLYKIIMRLDKAEAIAFQDWVIREVLPAIRKTGGYMLA
ncbi:BRO-N domain-containing protein [Agrobacterium sp. 22-209-1]|uniref:BRO-N domain-containing protein n=1 Tax=Agrobacterium tumefaciens complex TaxID=1183400 RepID=UPI003AF3BF04